jgi:predicted alpha/beta superfamily hydrolase
MARPSGAVPEHGYPVMYVLDPSTAFANLVDAVRNQEQMFGPVVVVGVGYASDAESENRSYDLTPATDPKDLPAGPPAGWGATGGNDAFSADLARDLATLAPYGLKVQRVVFADETHNSVIPAYLARGARFTLQGWFE